MADLDLAIRQSEDDLRREQAENALIRHADTNADEAARERAVSDRARRDMELLARSPRLQNYFASSASSAALMNDDVRTLAMWDQLVGGLWAATSYHGTGDTSWRTRAVSQSQWSRDVRRSGVGQAILQGQRDIEMARLANRTNPLRVRTYDDAGDLTEEEMARLNELRGTRYDAQNIFEMVAQQVPNMAGSIEAGARRSIRDMRQAMRQVYGDGDPTGELGDSVTRAVLAPIAGVAAGIAGAGGFVRGSTGFMYELEAGLAFEEFRNFADLDGNRIDENIAADYASRVGMINASIEFASLGLLSKAVGLEELVSYAVRGGVRDALRKRGLAEAVRGASMRVAGGAASEGFTEAAQESVTIVLGRLAQEANGGEWAALNDQEIADRIWESFSTGAVVGGVLGSVPAGASFARDLEEVKYSRLQAEIFDAIGDNASGSTTRRRAPDVYAQAVNELTRNGPLEEVRVSANRFFSFFQERNEDPYAAADRLPGVGREALKAALDSGSEISMPTGTYAAHIAGTSAHIELAKHVRMGPDRMTPAEVEARLTLGVDLERATSEAVRLQGEARAAKDQEDRVYQRVLDQMESAEAFVPEANRAIARMISRGIVAQAKAGGIAPETLLDRIGLGVEGPFGGGAMDPRVEAILDRAANAAPEIPRNPIPRDRVRIATPRQIPRRVVEAMEAGEIDGLAYAKGDMLVSEDADGAQPWPVGREIFNNTYTSVGNGLYAKKAAPVGYFVTDRDTMIETREGPREAKAGDVVMIGAAGEMWPMPRADFDQRYDGADQAFEKSGFHPTALRFGSDADVMALQALAERKASGEEIMSSALLTAVAEHVESTPYTADLKTAMGPDFYVGREFVDPETGERLAGEAAVERLREMYRAKAGVEVANEKRAVIVIGYPGAGKSTFINNLAREMRAAVGDADVAKEFVPAYEQGYNTQAVHFESARLRQDAVMPLIEEGANLIVERVGDKADSVLANLEQLQEAGYEVSLLHIKVEPNEAVRRAAMRFIGGGRYIDPQYYRAIFGKVEGAFAAAVADSRWAGYVEVDANGPQGTAYASDAQGLSSGWLRTAALGRSATDAASDARVGGDRGEGARGDGFRQDGIAPAFYSAVARSVEASTTARAPGAQWWATISKAPGVKKEELQWIGLEDWLKGQEGQVSREDVLAFVRQNGVRVEETVLGDSSQALTGDETDRLLQAIEERDRIDRRIADLLMERGPDGEWRDRKNITAKERRTIDELQARRDELVTDTITPLEYRRRQGERANSTKWSQYTLPGGENYRELLLRLPVPDGLPDGFEARQIAGGRWGVFGPQGIGGEGRYGSGATRDEAIAAFKGHGHTGAFKSSHFDQPNILAHIRFKERTDANGVRTLMIEEVQSDWHQAGRERGYGTTERDAQRRAAGLDIRRGGNTVPDAPFKNNAWANLAMKRAIRWAAENGFEQVAWTPGKIQADRFNLEKQISAIRHKREEDGQYRVQVYEKGGSLIPNAGGMFTAQGLRETFGIELAKKIEANEGQPVRGGELGYELSGVDLRMGGEGMRAFYDKILVNIANDLGKKYGARTSETQIVADKDGWHITPPEQTTHGKWMVKSSDYNSTGLRFETEAEAQAALAAKQAGSQTIVHSLPITAEMREAAMEGQALFQRNQTAQGQTIFQRDEQGFIKSAIVRFTERRDLSTPIHEFGGHVFLETLRIIAAEPTATDQARADWQTVLDWFGTTDAQWSEMSKLPLREQYDALRPYHEKFARGFEVYVMEGRSPSNALRSIFGMFKRWMISLYKEISNIPDAPELTPQIRAVYDRLVATEEEIAQAQTAMGADTAMTREQFGAVGNKFADQAYQRYLQNIERAKAEAAEEVERRAIGVLVAEQKRWWRQEERKVRETVKIDLQAQADWTAYDWLTGKRIPDGAEAIRLSPTETRAAYPASIVDMLPKELLASDIESLTAQARAVKQALRAPRPKRFLEAISDLGGIKLLDSEANGSVMAVLGTDKAVPVRGRMKRQLINNASGRPLDGNDGLIQALWEMGYFGAKPAGMGFSQSPDAGGGSASQTPDVGNAGGQGGTWVDAYHGTGVNLEGDFRPGSFFASEADNANTYARDNVYNGRRYDTTDDGGRVYPTRINTEGFETIDLGGRWPHSSDIEPLRERGVPGVILENVEDAMSAPGKRGAPLRTTRQYVVFDTSRVQSRFAPNAPARGDEGDVDPFSFFQDGAGYGERPSIDEFLNKLDADLRGDEQYSIDDEAAVQAIRDAERTRDWFAERGVDIEGKPGEVKRQIEAMAPALDFQGLDADEIASMVNGVVGTRAFESGQELLEALARLPKFEEAVKQETERRLRQKFGDPFEDGSIAEQARQAAHGAAAEARIEIELDAIERATGGQQRPVNAAAKAIAERQIERMSVKQIRKYDWFLGNERRHAKQAQEALAKGDTFTARQAKHRQLVNFHLYRLARAAADEMDRAQRHFIRLQRLGVRAAIDPDYLDQIDGLLERYEMRKISGPEVQRRIALATWVRSMEDRGLGHLVTIDPRIVEQAQRQPFDQLNLDEARALVDAVRNIEHLGRLKDKLLDAADQRAFADIVGGLTARLEATGPISSKIRQNYSGTAFERASDEGRKAHAEMTRMEFLFRYLDGGFNGPIWNALWAPFARAADKESAMMNESARRMRAIWARYTGKERARMFKTRYSVSGLAVTGATSYTRAELISIALNLGNEGNTKALVDGFGWATQPGAEIDYAAAKKNIVAELDKILTQRDWETVQQLWDLIASYRDEAFQLQEDLTGLRPEAVQADPVETSYGTLPGGYYPLKFDRTRDVRVEKTEAKQEVQDLYGSNWTAPMTRKGHLISRVGSGGRPVRLSLTVGTEHIHNVIHDVSYRRAVIDVNRIVGDKNFSDAFIAVAGRPMYDQLPVWLQAIAADRVDPSSFVTKFWRKFRGNVAASQMGYKIGVGLQQFAGLLQAVPMVGGPEMAGALVKLLARPDLIPAKARFIMSRSEFMRSRVESFDRDAREQLTKMERNSRLDTVREFGFRFIGMFDWAVSSTVWTAAYEKARSGKVDGIDAIDEEVAVRYADSMVRNTQSAGLPQDLPNVMRSGEGMKIFTVYFNYFSVLYNWTAYDQVMSVRKGRIPVATFAANMALIYIIGPLLAETLAGRGLPEDDESPEEYAQRLAFAVFGFWFAPIPILRDVINSMAPGRTYQMSPVGSAMNTIIDATKRSLSGDLDSSEFAQKQAVMALGYTFGVPSSQGWISGDYIRDTIEGDEEQFDPTEALLRDSR